MAVLALAVNHGDSDSTGSIAGSLLGLLHGVSGIPKEWLDQLELRDVIERVGRDLWSHFGPEERGPCSGPGRLSAGVKPWTQISRGRARKGCR